ncbi:MAG TPA: helix-turn-helix transcriptional regulator [bacterium]|nr:helix-turn-helix transcriptional regulator [bacterium]HOG43520.1 helix-turn-helix transcriptional regulator [bacterium]HPV21035.1 helix-turn-helix transcriptional regulator [bacterium]HPY14059.1 helix-turn-helix transcriptional regulator [bacterium]HQB10621.1 helix-turn-helix transcriptional regulator [bacterium]
MKVEKALADILRRERRKKKLSQEKIAILAGVDRSYYSKIERGENKPTLNILFKISAVLETKLSEIIREIEAKTKTR